MNAYVIQAAEENYSLTEYSIAKTSSLPPHCFGCGKRRGRLQAFVKFAEDGTAFREWFVWCGRRSCTTIITEVNY